MCGNVQTHTACAGKVFLDKVIERYFPMSTGCDPVRLFNPSVLELQAGKHPKVGTQTLLDNVAGTRLIVSRLYGETESGQATELVRDG